jgi:hypothetical protein
MMETKLPISAHKFVLTQIQNENRKHTKSALEKYAKRFNLTDEEAKKTILYAAVEIAVVHVRRLQNRKFYVAAEWSVGPALSLIFKQPLFMGTMYATYGAAVLYDLIPRLLKRKRLQLENILEAISKVSPSAKSFKEIQEIKKLILLMLKLIRL